MPITVKRNSYGRQLGSFHVDHEYRNIGKIPMTFIRAPHIESCAPEIEILATIDNRIVAAKYNNQLALSFHPELDNDTRIFEDFIKLI
jgi:5'-phosphate synthase pdxT subunit